LANIFSYSISSLPLIYLGLPLVASFKSKATWDNVAEKMERRSASWKKIYLSQGGSLTQIKSICPFFLYQPVLLGSWSTFKGTFFGML
jgi:hypothetical protein